MFKSSRHGPAIVWLLAILTAFPGRGTAWAESNTNWAAEIRQMSLDDLMNIDVTSVSKKAEKFAEAPAAIFVITQEDIRRSGATCIAEALRMAPGLEVARVDSHQWAISARGFNDLFADKLLVMVDGRSVYTPLFAGTYWQLQDMMLEDIERIEVIRGPGATVWGANAVNGVINIITKSSRDTQGGLLTAGGGSQELGFGAFRYGGAINDQAHYRLYGKFGDNDNFPSPDGHDGNNRWLQGHGGFRVDWDATLDDLITVQGDLYDLRAHDTFTVPAFTPPFAAPLPIITEDRGGNVLGRWTHRTASDGELRLQVYYDRTERDTVIRETCDTGDMELQYRWHWGQRQDLSVGLGYRMIANDIRNTTFASVFPHAREPQLFSTFVQDEISIVPDRLKLTLGSKFEHNDFTGFEVQPGLRLAWTPDRKQTIWASVSRAVRTPSLIEANGVLNEPGVPPGYAPLRGNNDYESEELVAYELGYRVQPLPTLTLDAALFYNVYDKLRTLETPLSYPGPVVVANNLAGETYGAELAARWQALERWRLEATYSWLDMQLHRTHGSLDLTDEQAEGRSPAHQLGLRSLLNVTRDVDFDAGLRFVDRLPALAIPAYLALDLRLAWRPIPNLELSVVGENLLQPKHQEFTPSFIGTPTTDIPRSVYGKITWRF